MKILLLPKKLCGKAILTSVLFLFLLLDIGSSASGQSLSQKYTFTLEASTLEKAIAVIRKETTVPFAYTDELRLDKIRVKAHVFKEQPLQAILHDVLTGTGIIYKTEAGSVVLTRRKPTKKVQGVVLDEQEQPFPGVMVSGGGQMTTANAEGAFSLNVAEDVNRISFFIIGYETQEQDISGQSDVKVRMKPGSMSLNEVVVIGYGTQRRKLVTGAINSVHASDYEKQPVSTFDQALQGRVAGVMVASNSGAPGSMAKVRIRGANSINAGNEPLYVVDGVALSSMRLQDLNVNDIESMDVLKDAAATAIYGSRGANGVVIITTKKGKQGDTRIVFNSFLSRNHAVDQIDLLDAPAFAAQANRIAGSNVFENPQSLSTTDWQGLVFRNTMVQNHQLSISGGNEKSRFYLSGNYVDQPGIVVNTSNKRYSLNVSLDGEVSKRLTYGFSLLAARANGHNNENLAKGNVVSGVLAWGPSESPFLDNGDYRLYSVSTIWRNPYLMAREKNRDSFSNSGLAAGRIRYDITDWLRLDVNVGLDFNITKTAYLNNNWFNPSNPGSGQGLSESYTIQNSNNLTFHKTFRQKHDLSLSAIVEGTSSESSGFNAVGTDISTMSNGYYNLALNASQGINSRYSDWGILSYIGRLEYIYGRRYIVNATYRADGSSKFSSNKWGYFPSVGLAWIASEEDFLKGNGLISNLKVRGSWGKTGNQSIDPYRGLALLSNLQYSFGSTNLYQGYTLGNASPGLKWESTDQYDVGVDVGLLNDRFSFSIDFYKKQTKNLLLQVPVPRYNGGGDIWRNLGAVDNKGVEMFFGATMVKRKGFSWETSVNASLNTNEVVDIGNNTILYRPVIEGGGIVNTNIQVVKKGEPLGAFYLIPWEGIYQPGNEALGYKAGDNHYTDVSGNGTIGYEDRAISGSATPKFNWGLSNNLSLGNVSLNFLIQASHGQKIYNGIYASIAAPTSENKYPTLRESANYWTPENPGSVWADPASKTGRNFVESTQYLQNGSYVRLKNISLGYRFSKKVTRFADIDLSLSAQNLFTITNYKGYDPEASSIATTSDSDSGIDFGAYPLSRTITFGIKVNY